MKLGYQGAAIGFAGSLYPIYVRGETYLQARQGAEAVVEFRKILDHRGIVLSDPIGALARLQLGRAFVLSGDKNKARLPTRISSRFGKTPTRTSRSSSKPRRNTPSCRNSALNLRVSPSVAAGARRPEAHQQKT